MQIINNASMALIQWTSQDSNTWDFWTALKVCSFYWLYCEPHQEGRPWATEKTPPVDPFNRPMGNPIASHDGPTSFPILQPGPCVHSQGQLWEQVLVDKEHMQKWGRDLWAKEKPKNLGYSTTFRKTKQNKKLSTAILVYYRSNKRHTSLRIVSRERIRSME